MLPFNPHSIIAQYGLDLVCALAYSSGPISIRIRTGDVAIARAVARRFAGCPVVLYVANAEIASGIMHDYCIEAVVSDVTRDSEAEVEIIPFPGGSNVMPHTAETLTAERVVLITENSLSYRSLMRPGSIADNVLQRRRILAKTHAITGLWGLLDPLYIARTAIVQIAGHRVSTLHFRIGQQAADGVYVSGWRAWVSYVVVLTGDRRA